MKKPHLAINLFGYVLIAALLVLFNTSKSQSVAPLCAAQWNQGAPYNSYCPVVYATGDPALLGCTAVGLAIVGRYYGSLMTPQGTVNYTQNTYPAYPTVNLNLTGKTYNFNNMHYVSAGTTNADISAYCLDMAYACGSRFSGYGTAGFMSRVDAEQSGYYNYPTIQSALEDNLGFARTIKQINHDTISDAVYQSLIANEIRNGRPVIMAGGQHLFVADGVDDNGRIHLNLGPGQGWYDINDLGGYDYMARALIGIQLASGLKPTPPPCNSVWQCQYSNGVKNGYEYDNCGNVRVSASCSNTCISYWVCEQPLNGYQSDGCGNRRLSNQCKKKGRKVNWEEIETDYEIVESEKTYNILGQEVSGELQSGMYVRDGKKIVVIE